MKKVKVVVVEPNKEPYVKEIEDNDDGCYEAFKNIVGGYIENIEPFEDEHIALEINADGRLIGLPYCRTLNAKYLKDTLFGTFCVTKHRGINTVSLSQSEIDEYTEMFKLSNDKPENKKPSEVKAKIKVPVAGLGFVDYEPMDESYSRTILTSKDIKINECKLLSYEEANKGSSNALEYGKWWWLRSPGFRQDRASYVPNYGSADGYGKFTENSQGYVRPALFTTLKSDKCLNLKKGDIVEINGLEFIYFYDGIFLLNGDIGRCAFRKDWEAEDTNDYEASDVKKKIDRWFNQNFSNFNSVQESYRRTRIRRI